MTIETDSLMRPKERIEAIDAQLGLALKLPAGCSAIATFLYLIVIQYFPSGLTPGEVATREYLN